MDKIGKFEVIELLGRGAMGIVYKGRDPSLARHVAIKVMTSHLEMDPELRTRFLREAQAAGSLQHPNITTIYELGESGGQAYIVMEFVPGRDLDDIIASREALTVVEKVDVVEQVCRGLAYAHDRQIVHRDVKPANIRVTEAGQVKLMDFGVAHLISSELTQAGSLMGTPYYMAPEVITGDTVDARADIFSLGATFYELISYNRPFQGDSLQTVFNKILLTEPAPLRELGFDVGPQIQKVLDRSLAKEPRDRYADTGEFLADLTRFWDTIPAVAEARAAASTALGSTASKAVTSARRRWKRRRLIPVAAAAAIGLAGLIIVGGAVVWPMLFAPTVGGPAEQVESVGETTLAGQGGDMPPADSDVPGSRPASTQDVEGAARTDEIGAPQEPAATTTPPTQPSEPAGAGAGGRPAVDRRPYDSASEAAGEARNLAMAAGAPELAGGLFRQAESLRTQAVDAAGRARYSEAASYMEQARLAYDDARRDAAAAWQSRLDSARTEVGRLRSAADPSAAAFADGERARQQAEAAERAGEHSRALEEMNRAAESYRLAAAPAARPTEQPRTPAPEPTLSTEEIVAATLEELRRAIEAENLTALRRVWVGLTAQEIERFEAAFDIMADLQVAIEVRSLKRSADRIEATVETTYDFLNETSNRRETQTFPQVLELAERDGAWVIVAARS
jgi:tRNA A-37 threonylcarbamoyl transferase component Bud32